MKTMKSLSKVLCLSLLLVSGITKVYAEPGNLEAINSASDQLRNIIGIEISTATDAQRAAIGCAEKGVYVSAVIPKHPADIAGLKVGDIITKVDVYPVTELSEALTAMNGLEGGRRYPFEICRKDGKGVSQKVTISVLVESVKENAIGRIS